MSKPIDGTIVRKLRKLRGLTQADLADTAKITKDTVSRLERGEQSGTGRAGKALAKALGVEPAVLTGDAKIPTPDDETASSWLDRFTYPLNVRVDGAVQNAFELTALRYQVPVAQIVSIAPLLFVLAAERSLLRRRRLLAELEAQLDRADGLAGAFPHLPTTFLPSHALDEHIGAEEKSIAKLDILALRLEDDSIWNYQEHGSDYEWGEHNPFVMCLQEEATNPAIAEITGFSTYGQDFIVCRDEALHLTGGDTDLANDILIFGTTRLQEMPDELWQPGALDQRLAWMRQKALERKANLKSLYDELGIENAETSEPSSDEGAQP